MAKTVPVLILELIDRSKSDFIMEGTERTANPVHLDSPSFRRILPTSTIRHEDPETGKVSFRRIRHIQGAPSIFVDEQDAQGFKYNPRRDQIFFDGPDKTILRDGTTINMYDYLKACEFNWHAEGASSKESAIFREVRAEERATVDVSRIKIEAEAANIVADLYYSNPDGSGFLYERERMRTITQALGLGTFDSDSETLAAINSVAKYDPIHFVNSVANQTVDYIADVKESLQLGVLSLEGGASLMSNQTVFLKLKSRQMDGKVDELLRFFLTPSGAVHLKQMRAELEQKRAALLATE